MSSSTIAPHLFASATRDEAWIVDRYGQRLEEERSEGGVAVVRPTARGTEIEAADGASDWRKLTTDDRAAAVLGDGAPRVEIEPAAARVRTAITYGSARVRALSIRRFVRGSLESDDVSRLLSVSIPYAGTSASIVTTEEALARDLVLLQQVGGTQPSRRIDYESSALLWNHGTAAVLLHEAVGHPAEIGAEISMERWIQIVDDPKRDGPGRSSIDDTGEPTRLADLAQGEQPAAFRRESWRDVPRRRMTNLVVSASRTVELPGRHIDILLIAGGHYDPLTDLVTLRILAADLVEGITRARLHPFIYRQRRQDVLASLRGAAGEATAYPGVACFSDGQRAMVGSFSPPIVAGGLQVSKPAAGSEP